MGLEPPRPRAEAKKMKLSFSPMSFTTPLTNLLNIKVPLVSAAMTGISGGAMAGGVTAAGGFGFLAAGFPKISKEIGIARTVLSITSPNRLPIGIGFLGWLLDSDPVRGREAIQVATDNARAIWFSFGEDLTPWITLVRECDLKANRITEEDKTLVFVVVNSVQEATRASSEWKADVIIAQGIEAGGHGSATAPPLMLLLPSVLSALATDSTRQPPPVLAAGGLVSGAHLAACLTLGAAGVVMGTRFLYSPESLYSKKHTAALLAAKPGDAVRSSAWDEVQEGVAWPRGVDGRALRNTTLEEKEGGVELAERKSRYAKAVAAEDVTDTVVWAGSGVGLIHELKPVTEIVTEIKNEAVKSLKLVAASYHE